MSKYKGMLHAVAIVLSAIVSAMTAAGMGGDPLVFGAMGATANAVIAYV